MRTAKEIINKRIDAIIKDGEKTIIFSNVADSLMGVLEKFNGKVFNEGLMKKINLALKENGCEYGITTKSSYSWSTSKSNDKVKVYFAERKQNYHGEDFYTNIDCPMGYPYIFKLDNGRLNFEKTKECLLVYMKYILEDNNNHLKEIESIKKAEKSLQNLLDSIEELNKIDGSLHLDLKDETGYFGKAFHGTNVEAEKYYQLIK